MDTCEILDISRSCKNTAIVMDSCNFNEIMHGSYIYGYCASNDAALLIWSENGLKSYGSDALGISIVLSVLSKIHDP